MASPYFTSGPLTLYHGDCTEVLAELVPGSWTW